MLAAFRGEAACMLTRLIKLLVRGGAAQGKQGVEVRPAANKADHGRAAAACREAATLIERGHFDAAEKRLREAIDLQHDLAQAHFQLGALHERRGELEDAADCHQLAVHFDPTLAAAHFALAGLHKGQGRYSDAAGHYRRVIEHDPGNVAAHCNLCLALYENAEYPLARTHGERALEIDPRLPEAHHNLGLVLMATGNPVQAAQHFRRALKAKPRAEIASALGHAWRDMGRLDDAVASYERAVALTPGFGDAVINRAYAYLLKPDYKTGWDEYEKRFVATGTKCREFGLPRWNGEPLRDKTILVHAEQGLGDEIMFATCLPDLVASAGRVVIECSNRLEALFRRSFPQATVHGGKKEDPPDWVARHAPIDYQIPIGSLPRHFRSEVAAFPGTGGYLKADPLRVREWRERVGAPERRPAIGLSWRGGTPKTRSLLRSVPLDELGPLLRLELDFISLQHGEVPAELGRQAAPIRSFPVVTEDLDELAALVCALDLIVSVDNTNVHLAGALGRPVWVLLAPSPEWRYGLNGDTMPWYPSARLFRRDHGEAWGAVLARLVRELGGLLAQPRGSPTAP
jgi:tetratricopeptide (TPR) repeat protein